VTAASDPPAAYDPEEDAASESAEAAEIRFEPDRMATYPRTTPDFVRGILLLNQHLPEGTPLQYDPEFGLGWQDPAGWLVYFGKNIQDVEIKLTEYQVIIEKMQAQGLTPALISLEFLHAPFYRMEQ
jgi:hypothetical protein